MVEKRLTIDGRENVQSLRKKVAQNDEDNEVGNVDEEDVLRRRR